MAKAFMVTDLIPAAPEQIYNTWLDTEGHSRMTGSPARVGSQVGETFEAWDGYISGTNLELEPGKRIRQSWRTVEFAPDEEDSILEITFEAAVGGTKLTLHHSNLPEHGDQYRQGWVDSYFEPMKEYFVS